MLVDSIGTRGRTVPTAGMRRSAAHTRSDSGGKSRKMRMTPQGPEIEDPADYARLLRRAVWKALVGT